MNNEKAALNAKLIRIGVVTLSAGVVANFVPVIYLWLAYGEIPPLADILKIWTVALVTFGVVPFSVFSNQLRAAGISRKKVSGKTLSMRK